LAHWKARSRLSIRVNWTFSLGIAAEALRANIDYYFVYFDYFVLDYNARV